MPRRSVRVTAYAANGTELSSRLYELGSGSFSYAGTDFGLWFHPSTASVVQQRGGASGVHVVITPLITSSLATASSSGAAAAAPVKSAYNVYYDHDCSDSFEIEWTDSTSGARAHLGFNPTAQ